MQSVWQYVPWGLFSVRLDELCVSLELAKRLKEFGVKQESIFVHLDSGVGKDIWLYSQAINCYKPHEMTSAFTAGEMGEMLPFRIFYNERWHGIEMVKGSREYVITYRFGVSQCPRLVIFDKTEANARAKMLIYLIENRLIEVKYE